MSEAVGIGYYGKLPSRGDFVRSGLSRELAAAWDGWVHTVLPPVRRSLGARWEEVWRAAPAWRFALAAGLCGARPVTGVWLASTDTVGRSFPFLIAAEACIGPDAFADLEPIAAEAVRSATAPEMLAGRLQAALRADDTEGVAAPGAHWRTGPAAAPCRAFSMPTMPDPACLLGMLTS